MKSFLDQQVDMKIMYYELIKMLMEHDKDQQSEEEYNITKTVHKIEGKIKVHLQANISVGYNKNYFYALQATRS